MAIPSWLLAAVSGLGLGLSLIVAIGAQNAFVIRQGVLGRHVLPVVVVCAASDAVLIAAGVGGLGAAVAAAPAVVTVIRYAGAAVLFGYGVLALRRVLRAETLRADATGAAQAFGAVVVTCLALTWLNPHVYLDTVLLLGSVASTYAHPDNWFLGAGAMLGSVVWFTALGYGARSLRSVFVRPLAWRVLDTVIALVMFGLAIGLLLGG